MDKEIGREWVERLESGRYKQGKILLRSRNDEYCCLGVLCEMAVEAGVVERAEFGVHDAYTYGDGLEAYPAGAVLKWAGLEQRLGTRYASRNDRGDSFETIARQIREDHGLA